MDHAASRVMLSAALGKWYQELQRGEDHIVPGTTGSRQLQHRPRLEAPHRRQHLPAIYLVPKTVPGTQQVLSGCWLNEQMTQQCSGRRETMLTSGPPLLSPLGDACHVPTEAAQYIHMGSGSPCLLFCGWLDA